ncbi:MAG TPA: DoxX family protein, partial [Candidatus Paceibacterota bacterium]|nr:DoxX family protein [Candidatus Paceibacterota bacterium]
GDHAGGALAGFINGALAKTGGEHPDVQAWYASFLHDAVLPNVYLWSHMVVLGEMLVGIALIAGFLVGISAFIGTFMSFNFLLAGTVSINPFLVAFGILLVLAWRVSGYIGLDYYVLPMFHRYLRPKRVLWS